MGFKEGFGKMVGMAKGLVGRASKVGPAAGSALASGAEKAAIKADTLRYANIDKPNAPNRLTGFLAKNSPSNL